MSKRVPKADETMAQALRKPTQEETRSYRDRIRELVEQDRVGAARALLAEALEHSDSGEDLSLWREILAPARVSKSSKERDFDRSPEMHWLAQHGREYRGKWVALLGEELLAHSTSLKTVVAALEKNKPKRRPLLHYIG
jgi:hypothetical protein